MRTYLLIPLLFLIGCSNAPWDKESVGFCVWLVDQPAACAPGDDCLPVVCGNTCESSAQTAVAVRQSTLELAEHECQSGTWTTRQWEDDVCPDEAALRVQCFTGYYR
jgi:hypothetical protein